MRLDELVVERKLAENKEKAKRMIMAGLVFTEQSRLDKPGMTVSNELPIYVKDNKKAYVSRGGLKLEKAIHTFQLDLKDKIMLDVGSSTGGFTDCALKHGLKQSYAIDVGYNQLDWKLRNDERVVVMERTNFRHVTKEMLTEGEPNFASIDVSFISLRIIFPVLRQLLNEQDDVVALIKPQFEAKKEQVETGGIITDKRIHVQVLDKIVKAAKEESFILQGMTHSPIKGGHGNIEYLAHFKLLPEDLSIQLNESLEQIVENAHNQLHKE